MAFFLALTLSFALLDTLAKYLTRDLPVVQIVWGRYVFHVLLLALFLMPRMGPRLVVSRQPVPQLARSGLIALITVLFVTTLVHLPLVDVTAIGYVSPLVVTAMGALVLGEKVGARRWTAVMIGFLGVLIIVRPGFAAWHWSLALAVFVPVLNACYHIVTRVLAGVDAPMTSLFYSGIVGAVGMSLFVPFIWAPLDAAGWAGLVGLGVFGAAGHYFMIKA
jgi:drug/metabolite transporter (DMT)-like permease